MNKTINDIKEYQFLNRALNVFGKKVITLKHFAISYMSPFLFLMLGRYFYQEEYHFLTWNIALGLGFLAVCVCIVIASEFLCEERAIIISKSKFYRKHFNPEEQETLSKIFENPFEDLIKENTFDIRENIIDRLDELEKVVLTRDYIQSLKDTISESPEHETYLPALKDLTLKYNQNLKRNNDKFEDINNELSKAKVSLFNDKKEESFLKIVEQE